MKALKIIGIVLGSLVGLLLLAGGIFWIGWLSPPSAESVCDNVAEVTAAATGRAYPEQAPAECLVAAATPPRFGRMPWVTELKCMRDATDLAALEACERR